MATVEDTYSVASTIRDWASSELGCNLEVGPYDRDRNPVQHLRSTVTDGQGRFRLR